MQSKKQNLEKGRRASLAVYMTVITLASLYAGLHLGVVYLQMSEPNLFGALAELGAHITEHPFELFPADKLMVGIFLFIGVMINLYLYNEYLKISHTVNDAHGDAAFEDNIKQYNIMDTDSTLSVTIDEANDAYGKVKYRAADSETGVDSATNFFATVAETLSKESFSAAETLANFLADRDGQDMENFSTLDVSIQNLIPTSGTGIYYTNVPLKIAVQ